MDTANFSFSETNAIQANGIRECFVNVSQISETSSCDYSMSQFRADESAFSIKEEAPEIDGPERSRFGPFGNETLDSQDDDVEDVPISQRKKIKREISDDEDEMPLNARKKTKTEKKEKKIKREPSDNEEDDYDKPKKKKIKKEKVT